MFSLSIIATSCQVDRPSGEEIDDEVISEFLPLHEVSFSDLSSFTSAGENWKVVSKVVSDFHKDWHFESEEGAGILLNNVSDEGRRDEMNAAQGEHLFTNFEHGDIQLEVEVMVPKESNSGIYFQSRYELQIRETSGDADVTSDDMGGIYARWEDPDIREKAIGGSAPAINAARAPGLWQQYQVLFRAPGFDEQGNKIENARFEYVYLNGYKVQDNVEVAGPTIESPHSDEVAMAPIMIQGDHGPVAFRNLKVKIFESEQPSLENISYKLYKGQFDFIPDFSTLEVAEEGNIENFDDLTKLAGQNDGFCIVFEGDLTVPKDGEYLFETNIDDGGDLFINDELVIHNQGEPGGGVERGLTNLMQGLHKIRLTYYQEVWAAYVILKIEGPGIEKMELPVLKEPKPVPAWARPRHLEIEVGAEPELIRGFVDHFDTKKTHILSVGTPQGVHYSYDTRNNELINLWKGKFADVGEMWINRGQSQRLDPLGAELGLEENNQNKNCLAKGYRLDGDGIPVFNYECNGISISDKTSPSQKEGIVERSISVDDGKFKYTIASDNQIDEMSEGWYSIGGRYYLRPLNQGADWNVSNGQISVDITKSSMLAYEIYW